MRARAERQPLLVVVEDLHWADDATLAHLATLAETVGESPAVLMMTSRSPCELARGAAAPPTITLDPLSPPMARALAAALSDGDTGVPERLVERAQGNPLFLEQLLRHAREDPSGLRLPGTVQSLVQAHVDRLAPPDRRAIQAASVLGQRFALEPWRALIEEPGYDPAGLLASGMIRWRDESFHFAHALVQEGVYGSLLRSRRRHLHARAAAWFEGCEPVLHAQHLDRAEDERAARAYLEAARVEHERYRTERAVELAQRGSAIARQRSDRFELALAGGDMLLALGRADEALSAFERARQAAEGERERCLALIGEASCLRIMDRLDEALRLLDQAQVMATTAGLVAERARIHHLRGNLHFPRGEIEACVREHETALAWAERAQAPELLVRALGGLADAAWIRGRILSAHRRSRRCVDLARQHGFGRIEVANLCMIPMARLFAGDTEGVLEEAQAAIAAAVRVGDRRAEICASQPAYTLLLWQLRLDKARDRAERARALAVEIGSLRFEAETLAYLSEVDRLAGQVDHARERLDQALALSCRIGMACIGPLVLGFQALATGDSSVRARALAEGEALLARAGHADNRLLFGLYVIESALANASWDEAERFAALVEQGFADEPTPLTDLIVARGRALARLGRDRRDMSAARELTACAGKVLRMRFLWLLPRMEQVQQAGSVRQNPVDRP